MTSEQVEASRLRELADYQHTPKPTPAERAEAWRRQNCDYEPEDEGSEKATPPCGGADS